LISSRLYQPEATLPKLCCTAKKKRSKNFARIKDVRTLHFSP